MFNKIQINNKNYDMSSPTSDEYKKLITTLTAQYKVPLIEIPQWIDLKDSCKLGLHSEIIRKVAKEKNKPEKIKPRCSSACIIVN